MKLLRTAMFLAVFSALGSAQDYRGTILGQVTDPSGAAIPNATVKATRIDTNSITEVKTSANGLYTIPFLNPGEYNVEVSAPGFNMSKREKITVLTADKLNLPFKLEVGQMSQEVTVTGQQENLETATASRGLNFDPT